MSNIYEAAKRVRDAAPRAGTDGWADTGIGTFTVDADDWQTALALARHVLYYDDPTPVTAEWLGRVGIRCFNVGFSERYSEAPDGLYVCFPGGLQWLCYYGVILVAQPTIGQVRSLCRALGVVLVGEQP